MKLLPLASVTALLLAPVALAGDVYQEAKLVSPDPGTGEIAGTGLAIDGDRIAMGVPHDVHDGNFYGAVHVYERRPGGWMHVQKLRPASLERNDSFGYAVAMQGNLMLVGAVGDDGAAPGCGRVYVYERGASQWQLVQELVPSDPVVAAFFGDGLAMDGDTALIGARFANGPVDMTGAAYVFVRQGGVWVEQAKLIPSDGQWDDSFGATLDLSGDTAVVGMHGDDTFGLISGAAYVYRRNGTTWTQAQKLLASDGAAGDMFGFGVSIHGTRIVVGAHRKPDQGVRSGAAYVFEDLGSGFAQTTKLLASDGTNWAEFGRGVAIRNDMVAVGAPRRVGDPSLYVFRLDGGTWSQTDKVVPTNVWSAADFANVVKTDGVRIAAGAPRDFIGVYGDAGSVVVFGVPPALIAYCEAMTSSTGCVPSLSWSGEPSASSSSPFIVRATSVPSGVFGTLFYSTTGRASQPFQGGTLCVAAPHTRTGTHNSGGTLPPLSDCSGVLSRDFNAVISAQPGLTAGTRVNGQFWFRDSGSAFGSGLSDALEFVILP